MAARRFKTRRWAQKRRMLVTQRCHWVSSEGYSGEAPATSRGRTVQLQTRTRLCCWPSLHFHCTEDRATSTWKAAQQRLLHPAACRNASLVPAVTVSFFRWTFPAPQFLAAALCSIMSFFPHRHDYSFLHLICDVFGKCGNLYCIHPRCHI